MRENPAVIRDYTTVLEITVDREGNVKVARVCRSSGVNALDATTVNAVQDAQPFGDVPPKLLSELWEWTFAFKFYVNSDEARAKAAQYIRR